MKLLLLYFIIGIVLMTIVRWRPSYMKGFKDGFDEGFTTNPNAVKIKEHFDENDIKTIYKVSLFTAILLDIIGEILVWPIKIFSRFY